MTKAELSCFQLRDRSIPNPDTKGFWKIGCLEGRAGQDDTMVFATSLLPTNSEVRCHMCHTNFSAIDKIQASLGCSIVSTVSL